ncbi:hypothetical protein BH23ACT3_BH23ACT3_00300 [soil metagenome]
MGRRRNALSITAVALLASLGLAGCFTGERPTLAEEAAVGAPVGDPASDAVLERFAAGPDATFTATYEITNNFGPITRDATVVQAPERRRSVTVGHIRYVIDGPSAQTCDLDTGPPCTDRIDDAAISDLQITHQFYSRSVADRLRVDAERRVGPTDGYVVEIAGRTAHCVSVPVSGGSKVYCVLDEGILAQYQGPDVLIVMTGFDPSPDESAFDLSR